MVMFMVFVWNSIFDSIDLRELLLNCRVVASDYDSRQLKNRTWPITVWWPIEMWSFAFVFISPTKYGMRFTKTIAQSVGLSEPGLAAIPRSIKLASS